MTGKHPARLHLTDWLPGRRDRPVQKLLRPIDPPGAAAGGGDAGRGAPGGRLRDGATSASGTSAARASSRPARGSTSTSPATPPAPPLSYLAPFARQGGPCRAWRTPPTGQYLTDRLTTRPSGSSRPTGRGPFFLYLPHYAVHTPMTAKADLIAGYPKWDGTPHGRQENPIYAAMLESLDESVGRIVAKLDELGLTDEHDRRLHQRQRRPGDARRPEHARHEQRPAPRGEGLALRRGHARPLDRALAGPDRARASRRRRSGRPTCSRRPGPLRPCRRPTRRSRRRRASPAC